MPSLPYASSPLQGARNSGRRICQRCTAAKHAFPSGCCHGPTMVAHCPMMSGQASFGSRSQGACCDAHVLTGGGVGVGVGVECGSLWRGVYDAIQVHWIHEVVVAPYRCTVAMVRFLWHAVMQHVIGMMFSVHVFLMSAAQAPFRFLVQQLLECRHGQR